MTDLPAGWVATTLDQIALWSSGGTPSRKRSDYFGGDIPWVKTGELTGKFIKETEETLTELGVKNSSAKVFPKGSVGIAMYGATIGKVSIWGIEASTNQACAVAQPLDRVTTSEFLYHFLRAEKAALVKEGKGGAQPNISQGLLKDWPIILPPLNEQRRIVEKIEALFDEIDAGVQSLKTARATLGLYRQSLLKSAFEGRLTADWRAQNAGSLEAPETLFAGIERERDAWHETEFQRWQDDVARWEQGGSKGPKPRKPEAYKPGKPLTEAERSVLPLLPAEWAYCRLSDIAHIGSGMSVSKARKHEDPIETPYLRVANVQRGYLDLAEIKSMPVERSQLPALSLRSLDILFNEGGDRDKLGRGWIWEDHLETCITQNHVFRATPFRHDKGWSIFISQWGNSYGRDYFETGGKQTTNLASINKTVLKALPVPICSAAEQAEIVRILGARLDAANTMEAEIDAALTRAEALRQSILKKAFSGQLVPQDPTDEPASALLDRIKADRTKAPKTKRRKLTKAKEPQDGL